MTYEPPQAEARRQRDPVNLVFEHGRQGTVLFGCTPHVPITPLRELPQLLDRSVVSRYRVPDREIRGVENADVAT